MMITTQSQHLTNGQRPHWTVNEQSEITDMFSTRKQSFFPAKLYDMLEDAEKKSFDHIISWMPSGTGFKIHNPKAFAKKILPVYFPLQTRYRSFTRQLNLYTFKMFTVDEDQNDEDDHHWGDNDVGGYVHPNFVRGQRSKCLDIVRKKKKKATKKKKTDRENRFQEVVGSTNHLEAAAPACYDFKEEGHQKFGIKTNKEKMVNHIPPKIDFFVSGVKHEEYHGDTLRRSSNDPLCRQDAKGDVLPFELPSLSLPPSEIETEDKPIWCSTPADDLAMFSIKTAGAVPADAAISSLLSGTEQVDLINFPFNTAVVLERANDTKSHFLHERSEEEGCTVSYEGFNSETNTEGTAVFDTVEGLLRRSHVQEEVHKSTSTSSSKRDNMESASPSWFEDHEKLLLDYARDASDYIMNRGCN